MTLFKKITITAMALSLVASLASCTSETDPAPVATAGAETSTPEGATEGATEGAEGAEGTVDAASYLADMETTILAMDELTLTMTDATTAYMADMENEELLTAYCDSMVALGDSFTTFGDVTAPEELAEAHSALVASGEAMGTAYVEMATIISEGSLEDEETATALAGLQETLVAAAEEFQLALMNIYTVASDATTADDAATADEATEEAGEEAATADEATEESEEGEEEAAEATT